ncbi:MAG: NAD(P)H-dependent oxidoreductase [Fimbriiglobus sp.]
MELLTPAQLLSALKWRYAVKKFDATKTIPAATWSAIEESLVLSPSSYGLQPWKFFVVTDPAKRQQLLPHSWGQQQVVDASHMVIFAMKLNFQPPEAQRLIDRIVEVRGVPAPALDGYKGMMAGFLSRTPQAEIDIWAQHQIYIALGNLMTSAAVLGVDACPMEGFLPAKYDEVLGLPAKGYRSIVMATLGYRAAEDAYASLPKVRYAHSDLVEHL